jgi:hypothetical protein
MAVSTLRPLISVGRATAGADMQDLHAAHCTTSSPTAFAVPWRGFADRHLTPLR